MCTLNQAIEHAAKHDELDLALKDLFRIKHERQTIVNKSECLKEYMEANKVFIKQINETINLIDNILTESTNYLAGRKLCLAS